MAEWGGAQHYSADKWMWCLSPRKPLRCLTPRPGAACAVSQPSVLCRCTILAQRKQDLKKRHWAFILISVVTPRALLSVCMDSELTPGCPEQVSGVWEQALPTINPEVVFLEHNSLSLAFVYKHFIIICVCMFMKCLDSTHRQYNRTNRFGALKILAWEYLYTHIAFV